MVDPRIIERIKSEEGLRLHPYKCPAGATTIGYGHNLDASPLPGATIQHLTDYGISLVGANLLVRQDIERAAQQIDAYRFFEALSPARQYVLIDMVFNLGLKGVEKFRRFLSSVEAGDYDSAAMHMLDSKWARQVPSRAERLAKIMATGEW
jgi:lysozyme